MASRDERTLCLKEVERSLRWFFQNLQHVTTYTDDEHFAGDVIGGESCAKFWPQRTTIQHWITLYSDQFDSCDIGHKGASPEEMQANWLIISVGKRSCVSERRCWFDQSSRSVSFHSLPNPTTKKASLSQITYRAAAHNAAPILLTPR